jgi:hypothetical protein
VTTLAAFRLFPAISFLSLFVVIRKFMMPQSLIASIEIFTEGLGLLFLVCTVVPILVFALEGLRRPERQPARQPPSDDVGL